MAVLMKTKLASVSTDHIFQHSLERCNYFISGCYKADSYDFT